MKLVTKEIAERFKKFPMKSQEGKSYDSEILAIYFNPTGRATWIVTEAEQVDDDYMFFGIVSMYGNDWEWGEFSLKELERAIFPPFGKRIERDLYTTEKTVKEYLINRGVSYDIFR